MRGEGGASLNWLHPKVEMLPMLWILNIPNIKIQQKCAYSNKANRVHVKYITLTDPYVFHKSVKLHGLSCNK
jgi:hypothetical protein